MVGRPQDRGAFREKNTSPFVVSSGKNQKLRRIHFVATQLWPPQGWKVFRALCLRFVSGREGNENPKRKDHSGHF